MDHISPGSRSVEIFVHSNADHILHREIPERVTEFPPDCLLEICSESGFRRIEIALADDVPYYKVADGNEIFHVVSICHLVAVELSLRLK